MPSEEETARMPQHTAHDWDPRDPALLDDQLGAYDAMRRRCPVAHSEYLHWSIFRHADVLRILRDPAAFSNAVSTHASIPNGMDPPEHTPWRALIEPYFAKEVLATFEPRARRISARLVAGLPAEGVGDWMGGFADECAVQLLCAYLGWQEDLHEPLRHWAKRNQAATLAGDRKAMSLIALEFDGHIRDQLAMRRNGGGGGADLSGRLLAETIQGRPLRDEEIVSIVRNWTVGELSTLSASIGILAQYLGTRPELQQRLREDPRLVPPAIDEILRIHPPLIANRRKALRPACIGGREIAPGARLTLMWASANRDETVFGDPDEFRLDRDPADNLLYGAGVHVCPGAGLSRLQLRIVLEAVLSGTRSFTCASAPRRARYPASGFSHLPIQVMR